MRHCNICGRDVQDDVEEASVRSNVRMFSGETFVVWRCTHCRSIHARDDVDLGHYYAHYPFHRLDDTEVDWMMRAMYRNMLKRLRRAGLAPGSAVLDYGCGSGRLVRYLRDRGYTDVSGFDEYSDGFADRSVLERSYSIVVSQDVLEHVPDPVAMLRTLDRLLQPGGAVVLGTPNADAIDLAHPEERVHTLHQPYHRHILSKQALFDAGAALGWELAEYYPTMYANTRVPFVNSGFIHHYFRSGDNNVDMALEPIKLSPRLCLPDTLYFALFGWASVPECDITAVFRKAA